MYSIIREKEFCRLSAVLGNLIDIVESIKSGLQISGINNRWIIEGFDINENKTFEFLSNLEGEFEECLRSLSDLRSPFLLFVVGSGNYGKSTLINALMEDTLIKTKDLPNTWKLDLFCKSKVEKMDITYDNKDKVTLKLDEGFRLLTTEEEKFKISRKKVFKILKEYKNYNNVSVAELKKYKEDLEQKYLYVSNIVEVKYYFNKNGILDDFIIVDTPGLNQILNKSILSSIKDYYLKSDGIIWIIDAQNIVSKNSNDFISDIDKLNKLHHKKKNMILVVNKMDIVKNNNENNSCKVKQKVNQIYNNIFDDVVFISAKDAVKGTILRDEELVNKSSIRDLRNSIEEHFKQISEISQIKSKHKNLSVMSDRLIRVIEIYKRELYKDISRYNESKFELNEKINNSKNYVVNLLIDMKSKSYYKEINLQALEKRLKEIEDICNTELNKLYEHSYKKANFNENFSEDKFDFKIFLTKNKNLIVDYKLIKVLNQLDKKESPKEKLLNSMRLKDSKRLYSDEIIVKNKVYKKLNILIEECINEINKKFKLIKLNIENTREKTFEDKYLEYDNIKNHIKELEKIYTILGNLR